MNDFNIMNWRENFKIRNNVRILSNKKCSTYLKINISKLNRSAKWVSKINKVQCSKYKNFYF